MCYEFHNMNLLKTEAEGSPARATHTFDGIKFVSVIVDQYSYFTNTLAQKDKDAQSVLKPH